MEIKEKIFYIMPIAKILFFFLIFCFLLLQIGKALELIVTADNLTATVYIFCVYSLVGLCIFSLVAGEYLINSYRKIYEKKYRSIINSNKEKEEKNDN